MPGNVHQLTTSGYEIVAISGPYCRVCRDGQDMLMRWNGQNWVRL